MMASSPAALDAFGPVWTALMVVIRGVARIFGKGVLDYAKF